ncbi:hypothetical protein [Sandaracinobacteroides hominis]|uniref:hypothetical protein n=1 Tax=Sandaracinobacteroides hominis TaxID=2780086 RepID=UPI0018F4F868|nr:hypothetical protein [Sandaracinobacteroides hominis]
MRLPARESAWSVAARVAAALLGGYMLAAASVALLSRLLIPWLGKVDAVWLGTMPGALIFATGIVIAFSARSAGRAWFWLVSLTAGMAATWLLLA